ncbi:hypothetical protein [Methylocaldum sp. 14B]|jgi:transposase|uniref:hypothetical protein n=1 Tax=Methylocaldum sp. 14B TaxID=1912213 RepID=UPI00098A6F62|nr:hypothetical protein [Methylocaldum sp. 14B]
MDLAATRRNTRVRYCALPRYRPALSAARNEPHLRGFYRHLIEHRGLKKIQAVCAVMRKLLTGLHAILTQRTPFDGRRLFALDDPIPGQA